MQQSLNPNPNWLADFGDPEDLQAVGAVIAAWNACEHSMLQLLHIVMRTDWETSCRLFSSLGNQTRADLLIAQATAKLSSDESSLVLEFVKHFSICRENRNIVAHSRISKNINLGGVTLTKSSSRDGISENYYYLTSSMMQQIANAIQKVSFFGTQIFIAIYAGPSRILRPAGGGPELHAPLPQKPPSPAKLTRVEPSAPLGNQGQRWSLGPSSET